MRANFTWRTHFSETTLLSDFRSFPISYSHLFSHCPCRSLANSIIRQFRCPMGVECTDRAFLLTIWRGWTTWWAIKLEISSHDFTRMKRQMSENLNSRARNKNIFLDLNRSTINLLLHPRCLFLLPKYLYCLQPNYHAKACARFYGQKFYKQRERTRYSLKKENSEMNVLCIQSFIFIFKCK